MEYGGAVFAGSWGQQRISRSTDNGASWQPMNTGLTTNAVNALAFMGTTMYAGSYGGVYRSTDSAVTWDRLDHQPGIVNAFQVSSTDLFVGTLFDGVHVSSDGGNNWRALHSGFLGMVITTMLRVGTTLYAGTASALYRSDDDGDSWEKTKLSDGKVLSLASDGVYLFAGTENNVLRSPDGGEVWIYAAPLAHGSAVMSLAVMRDGLGGSHLFAGTDSCGIYRSPDAGDSWIPFKTGLEDTIITCLSPGDGALCRHSQGSVCHDERPAQRLGGGKRYGTITSLRPNWPGLWTVSRAKQRVDRLTQSRRHRPAL